MELHRHAAPGKSTAERRLGIAQTEQQRRRKDKSCPATDKKGIEKLWRWQARLGTE